jgi:hypothetical protein
MDLNMMALPILTKDRFKVGTPTHRRLDGPDGHNPHDRPALDTSPRHHAVEVRYSTHPATGACPPPPGSGSPPTKKRPRHREARRLGRWGVWESLADERDAERKKRRERRRAARRTMMWVIGKREREAADESVVKITRVVVRKPELPPVASRAWVGRGIIRPEGQVGPEAKGVGEVQRAWRFYQDDSGDDADCEGEDGRRFKRKRRVVFVPGSRLSC